MRKFTLCWLSLIPLALILLSCDKSTSSNGGGSNTSAPQKYGSLLINVSGLPLHLSAIIEITGPENYSRQVSSGMQIDSLIVGSYIITSSNVVDSTGDTILTMIPAQLVDVTENQTTTVEVTYQYEKYGSLLVDITGLPQGTDARIKIYDEAQTVEWDVTRSIVIDSMIPGPYQADISEVTTSDGVTYVPDSESQLFDIQHGVTATLPIIYKEKYGSLLVDVSGLPLGTDAKIKIYDEAQTVEWDVTRSIVIDSMIPGPYQADISEVTASDGVTYVPDSESQLFDILHGTTVTLPIIYKEKYGKLQVNITGLPEGVAADVEVFNADLNYSYPVAETELIDSLLATVYEVDAFFVIDNEGDTLTPEMAQQNVTIMGGETATADVHYKKRVTITMFHGKSPLLGESAVEEFRKLTANPDDTSWSRFNDKVTFPEPHGYIVEDCKITGTEEMEVSGSTQISGSNGSASAQTSYSYDDDLQQLVINSQSQANSSPETGYYRTSTHSYAVIYFAWTYPNSIAPIIIDIENPFGDSIFVDFEWTYNASISSNYPNFEYGPFHWEQVCEYAININPCQHLGGVQKETLFRHNKASDPGPSASGSGAKTIVLTGEHVNIGLHTQNHIIADAYHIESSQQTYYSTVSAGSEVTITFRVVRNNR